MPLTTKEKSLLARVRRMADRQYLRLLSSRRRDPHATDFQHYQLRDAATDALVYPLREKRPFASLEAVEKYLLRDPVRK